MPPGRIEGPSAWRGPDMTKSEEWLYRLSTGEVAELDQALERTRARGHVEIGRRGGILVPGTAFSAPLEPC